MSWRQPEGYGGFLHHAIHGTVNWEYARLVPSYTYEPLINSFINLYEKSHNNAWLEKAEEAVRDLSNIVDRTGQFKYSGFEFAPKSGSIVHTVNPLFSILRLYKINNDERLLALCKKVLESVTAVFWRGDTFAGPFNMTLMVAAAMAEYGMLSNDWRLNDYYGKKVFDQVKNHKVGEEGGEAQGLYYRNSNDHSIIFPWYNTVKAQAMCRYGKATGEIEWYKEGISLLKRIKTLFKDDYTLPHSFQFDNNGNVVAINTPILVAPSAYVISVMQQYHILESEEINKAIDCLLQKQTSIGFIPSNEGYDWRSKIGVTAWNCFVMELMSQNYVLNNPETIKICKYREVSENIVIEENTVELRIYFKNNPIVIIDKVKGTIKKLHINDVSNFKVEHKYVNEAIHIVKKNAQRHYAVSYIDSDGSGIWLENYDGECYAWSPYVVFDIKEKGKIVYKGKQKYDKYSLVLSKLMRPVIYKPYLLDKILRILK